jgi:hypothetical protein
MKRKLELRKKEQDSIPAAEEPVAFVEEPAAAAEMRAPSGLRLLRPPVHLCCKSNQIHASFAISSNFGQFDYLDLSTNLAGKV